MTIEEYENQGGFREELQLIREIGQKITTLQEVIPARPHTLVEREALKNLWAANDALRTAILRTRNG
jgi:hypothetical protein